MYTSNNQISGRQVMRLLTFDLLGYSALMIPAALAEDAGRDGIFSLLLGTGAGFLYLWLLKAVIARMSGSYSGYLTEIFGGFWGGVIKIGYLFYFFLLAGRVAVLFAELVETELLENQFQLILVLLMLLTFYGAVGGIEGRARVYEILFWIVLIPLLLMMLSALPAVDMNYWQPIFSATKSGVLRGGYRIFFGCSILFLLPFLVEHVKKRESLCQAGKWALAITGGILILLYLVLLGTFGSVALATIPYPAVTLMSRVQITGGFLKRVDAIMFGIWFFTLFALLNSLMFFAGKLLADCMKPVAERVAKRLQEDAGKNTATTGNGLARGCLIAAALLVFVLAEWLHQSEAAKNMCEQFLWYVGTPFVVLVPFFLWCREAGRGRQAGERECQMQAGERERRGKGAEHQMKGKGHWLAGIFSLVCLTLSGCAPTEIEDREFPVLLAVDNEENFSYEWLKSLQEGNKKIDYNHLKVVLLSQDFIENETAMAEMLRVLKQDKNVPLNAYVVITDDTDALVTAGEALDEPLGNYLEELLENSDEIKKETYPTLGMLYQEKENQLETLFIPYISLIEEKPEITAYEAYKRGKAEGIVESDVALLSFFTSNQMKEYVLQLGGNNYVRLSNAKNEITFEEHIKPSGLIQKQVQVHLNCDAEIIVEKVSGEGAEVTNWLETQMLAYMQEKAAVALERGIDLTNSKKMLGGAMRSWYDKYEETPEQYEKDIEIVFEAELNWSW